MLPLFSRHRTEIDFLPGQRFAPQRQRYETMEAVGAYKLFTARVAGRIVGYSGHFVMPHAFLPDTVWGVQDMIYMLPEYRGRPAARFLVWADLELQSIGVRVIMRTVNKRLDWSRILAKMGYVAEETGYMKVVGD